MFLDSNILIHYYLSKTREGPPCATLMRRISSGEQKASISPLVVDEVLYILIKKRGRDFAQRALQAALMNPNLQILSVDQAALSRLPAYLEQGMEPRDALHAATMAVHGISTICSFDEGFDSVAGIRRQLPK